MFLTRITRQKYHTPRTYRFLSELTDKSTFTMPLFDVNVSPTDRDGECAGRLKLKLKFESELELEGSNWFLVVTFLKIKIRCATQLCIKWEEKGKRSKSNDEDKEEENAILFLQIFLLVHYSLYFLYDHLLSSISILTKIILRSFPFLWFNQPSLV